MKIVSEARPVSAGSKRDGERRGRFDAAGGPSTGDTVTISEEARRRVEASDRGPAAMGPEERAQLVAALKAQVDSGNYRPDLRRTALFLVRDGDESLT